MQQIDAETVYVFMSSQEDKVKGHLGWNKRCLMDPRPADVVLMGVFCESVLLTTDLQIVPSARQCNLTWCDVFYFFSFYLFIFSHSSSSALDFCEAGRTTEAICTMFMWHKKLILAKCPFTFQLREGNCLGGGENSRSDGFLITLMAWIISVLTVSFVLRTDDCNAPRGTLASGKNCVITPAATPEEPWRC